MKSISNLTQSWLSTGVGRLPFYIPDLLRCICFERTLEVKLSLRTRVRKLFMFSKLGLTVRVYFTKTFTRTGDPTPQNRAISRFHPTQQNPAITQSGYDNLDIIA